MEQEIYNLLPMKIKEIFHAQSIQIKDLQEIRFRIGQPVIVKYKNKEYFLSMKDGFTRKKHLLHILSKEEMRQTLEYISEYSLYAYEDQLKQGFITVKGGHRIGIAGKVRMEEGKIKVIKHIAFLNIRVAHEVIGCAQSIFPFCRQNNHLLSVLIISPPGCGKTTLLRDMIRLASSLGETIGVVDERSEIAASYLGIPQNNVGIRTDVMDGCPKAEGFQMLVRTMAPDIVAMDEIGTRNDLNAVQYGIHSGCRTLATIHGKRLEEIPFYHRIKTMFQRFVILDGINEVGHVLDVLDETETSMLC